MRREKSWFFTGVLFFLILAAFKYGGIVFIAILWIAIWIIAGLTSMAEERRSKHDPEKSN